MSASWYRYAKVASLWCCSASPTDRRVWVVEGGSSDCTAAERFMKPRAPPRHEDAVGCACSDWARMRWQSQLLILVLAYWNSAENYRDYFVINHSNDVFLWLVRTSFPTGSNFSAASCRWTESEICFNWQWFSQSCSNLRPVRQDIFLFETRTGDEKDDQNSLQRFGVLHFQREILEGSVADLKVVGLT